MNKILVVAAHPDDDILGMGGTLAKYAKQGNEIKVIFMTDGVSSREIKPESSAKRFECAIKALKLLGVEDVSVANFPDNQLDKIGILELTKHISTVIEIYTPNIVYTHFQKDLNVDHRLTAEATIVCSRPTPSSSIKQLCHFEVASSTNWYFGESNFSPNIFVDIEETLDLKIQSLKFYDSEIQDFPHVRSYRAIENHANYRGNFVGITAAEAFEISFQIS
jgi:LmbE family N-acetylglucosaminyl deacetylase